MIEGPIHIIPNNDVVEHEDSATCDCDPVIMVFPEGNQVVHNSFDGREHFEPDHSRWDCKFCIQEPITKEG